MLSTPAALALLGDADPSAGTSHGAALRQHELRFALLVDDRIYQPGDPGMGWQEPDRMALMRWCRFSGQDAKLIPT
ncbi:MAG TPA: hypothetical protein DDY37_08195 [Legionella sp.]|nr:hypothetical protein [Legionella sp.]